MRNTKPQIAAHVPVEIRNQAEDFAKKNGTTMTSIVIEALTAFFKQQKGGA